MPIKIEQFYTFLVREGFDYFAGVPDSLLKSFCAYASEKAPAENFYITANEGSAVGVVAGYHIATGRYGVVYMQNSGIGNAINPLLSLVDEEVYSIPLLLIIGWRGEPGVKDEPQHIKQGAVTCKLLEDMGIDYVVLEEDDFESQIKLARKCMDLNHRPFAIIVRKDSFSKYENPIVQTSFELTREEALVEIVNNIEDTDYIVSTTGKTSRELFEIREANHQNHRHDFLTVGSMGHASSIAFGIACGTARTVWCIDGDGAFLMHMGSLPAVLHNAPSNLKYIVNVNGAHESVGGQPTASFDISIPGILKASGFRIVEEAQTIQQIVAALKHLKGTDGPAAMVLYTRQGSRPDLGRPNVSPQDNKKEMMEQFMLDAKVAR